MENTLYRFVKASERLPEGSNQKRLNILYKGSPDSLVYLHNKWHWWESSFLHSLKYPIDKSSWSAIEWFEPVSEDNQQELWSKIQSATVLMAYGSEVIEYIESHYHIIPKQVK